MNNQLKTVFLLGSLSGLLLLIGSFFGTGGLVMALIFSIIMNLGSYFFSDRIILSMYRAKEVTEADSPKLYAMVRRLCQIANIPMPRVYIIPSNSPNAFATGRSPDHAAVAFTEGILSLLEHDELEAVAAHELSHVKNRDILIATIAATIASIISYMAVMARWAAIFGGMGRDRDGVNIGELLVLAFLTPFIATILQLAISRSREFIADKGASELTRKPSALISALEKISHATQQNPLRFGNKATASLFIENPFKKNTIIDLFSTHPSLEKRVQALQKLS